MRFFLIFLFSVLSITTHADEEVFDVELAFDKNNRIVLPVPYTDIVVDNANSYEWVRAKRGQELTVRPKPGAGEVAQFTFYLANGDGFTLSFTHRVKRHPIVFRYKNAPDVTENVGPYLDDKRKWIAKSFVAAHQIYYGDADKTIPGMSKVSIEDRWVLRLENPNGTYSEVILNPVFAWSGMGKVLKAYVVQSDTSLEIENADFYSEGTIAVALESDVVTENLSPYLFILSAEK